MSDEIRDDPGYQAFERSVLTDLVPKLRGSVIGMALTPRGEPDVKFAVELGMMIMLDKPILLVVQPGQDVPRKLLAVADEVVEMDWAAPRDDARLHLQDAITAMTVRFGPLDEED